MKCFYKSSVNHTGIRTGRSHMDDHVTLAYAEKLNILKLYAGKELFAITRTVFV